MGNNRVKWIIVFSAVLITLLSTGNSIPASGVKLKKSKVYYVRTEFKNESTQKGKFRKLDEAKSCADFNAIYGYKVYSTSGEVVYATYGELAADILREAKYVTDYIRENQFKYGNAPINPAIDHTAKLVSCDRLVGWVMYRVGFTDQPRTNGLFVWSKTLDEHDLQTWCKLNGFEKVENMDELLPGDIVFVNLKSEGWPDHTFICAGVSSDSTYYRYDGGSDKRIQSVQPSSEPIIKFFSAYRPVK